MKKVSVWIVLCGAVCGILFAKENARAEGRIETVFIESDDAKIPSREVRVWLPSGYDKSEQRYPVIYFHDGQNVFRPGGTFGCWFAEDAMEKEVKSGKAREAIMVGVPNNEADGGKARITEYQPNEDKNPIDAERGGGLSDRYGKFLIEKVKAKIDEKYRTLADPENTIVAGSSMGGLVSLWLGLNTDVFGGVGVFSPAFWTSPKFMEAVIAGKKKEGLRVYLDMGTRERGNTRGDYWNDALAVRDAMIKQGWSEGRDLLWNPGQGDEHNEKAWAKRLPQAIDFLLPKETKKTSS